MMDSEKNMFSTEVTRAEALLRRISAFVGSIATATPPGDAWRHLEGACWCVSSVFNSL